MKKSIILIFSILGFIQIFGQTRVQLIDTLNFKQHEIDSLIQKNDSLNLIFYHVQKKVSKKRINEILKGLKNDSISTKEAGIALMAYAAFGDKVQISKPNEYAKNTYPEVETFADMYKVVNGFINYASTSYDSDGSIKRAEYSFPDGSVYIYEKLENGKYSEKSMTPDGIITHKEVDEPSIRGGFSVQIETSE